MISIKAKEPVRMRFKELANGNKSIYLDIYQQGKRRYEFLRLYLVPEVSTSAKRLNSNTLTVANEIKRQRIAQVKGECAGRSTKTARAKMPLTEWLAYYDEQNRLKGRRSSSHWVSDVIASLRAYCAEPVALDAVSKEFLTEFVKHLMVTRTRRGTMPAKATVANKLKCIKAALNVAVDEEVLTKNPASRIRADFIGGCTTRREYLTIDEVKRLISAPCSNATVKRAFLFSCFCGLRISDVRALRWRNVINDGGRMRVEIEQYKTSEPLYLPLNSQAVSWLPPRGEAESAVFKGLPVNPLRHLTRWCQAAGIDKHVTFHVSRHTFATMELTMGADLYTTSKLLGHTSVAHTQIYAKIINSKKDEAVSLLDKAFQTRKKHINAGV